MSTERIIPSPFTKEDRVRAAQIGIHQFFEVLVSIESYTTYKTS